MIGQNSSFDCFDEMVYPALADAAGCDAGNHDGQLGLPGIWASVPPSWTQSTGVLSGRRTLRPRQTASLPTRPHAQLIDGLSRYRTQPVTLRARRYCAIPRRWACWPCRYLGAGVPEPKSGTNNQPCHIVWQKFLCNQSFTSIGEVSSYHPRIVVWSYVAPDFRSGNFRSGPRTKEQRAYLARPQDANEFLQGHEHQQEDKQPHLYYGETW